MEKTEEQKAIARDSSLACEMLGQLEAEALGHQRISRHEALALYASAPLSRLGYLAQRRRDALHDPTVATYLVDRNINYTNVCTAHCSFCGFYRPSSDHPEAYVLSRDEIATKIEELLTLGGTRILLQGGHNDDLPYSYYVELIRWIKTSFAIDVNAFSPSEVQQMHKVSGKSYYDILSELRDAGLDGLPGGGAEILDDDIRKRVSPKKINADEWIAVMEAAHELDLVTTATMVIGFGESIEQRMNHLQRVRDAQDRAQAKGKTGFNAFIAWPLQHNENTSLGRSRLAPTFGSSATEYLRLIALARIFLDSIPHVQASWPTLGGSVAQIGLHFGCDDIGSTMMEENVVSQAGALSAQKWSMSPEELQKLIRDAGFTPKERNCRFEIRSDGDSTSGERGNFTPQAPPQIPAA